ncbi:hypothetical protein BDR22DRAFT_823586 [Usnea florida]
MREQQHAVDMRAAVDEAKNNAAVEAAMREQQYEMAKRAAVEDAIILQISHFTFFISRLSTLNTKKNRTTFCKLEKEKQRRFRRRRGGIEARQWHHPNTTNKITQLHRAQMARCWLLSQLESADPTSQIAWKHKPWKKDAKEIWLVGSITRYVVGSSPTAPTAQNRNLGAIERDGDVIDVFKITRKDTDTNRYAFVLRNREMSVIRADEMRVARGESVRLGYTITSVLDEEDFDAASVLVGWE